MRDTFRLPFQRFSSNLMSRFSSQQQPQSLNLMTHSQTAHNLTNCSNEFEGDDYSCFSDFCVNNEDEEAEFDQGPMSLSCVENLKVGLGIYEIQLLSV